MKNNSEDSLAFRMKGFEHENRTYLEKKVPVIIRLDGKAFHTFTKGLKKPFDMDMMKSMWEATKFLCENVQGCKLGYVQSDEISLLLTDYANENSDAWFGYNVEKMVSIAASMCAVKFNRSFSEYVTLNSMLSGDETNLRYAKCGTAFFDARAFNLPQDEVNNYFYWRESDCSRNSIQMVAQANFSHKELQGLGCNQLKEKLIQDKNINWDNMPISKKLGVCIIKENYQLDINEYVSILSFLKSLKDKQVITTQQHMSLIGMVKNNNYNDVLNYINKNNLSESYNYFINKEDKGLIRTRWVVDENIPNFSQDKNYVEKFV